MFLHQKRYEVHTLNEDIFYHIFQSVKYLNGTLLVVCLNIIAQKVLKMHVFESTLNK